MNGKEDFYQYVQEGENYEGFKLPWVLDLDRKPTWARKISVEPSRYHLLICNKDRSFFTEGYFQSEPADKNDVVEYLRYNVKGEKEVFFALDDWISKNEDKWIPYLKKILNIDKELEGQCYAWGRKRKRSLSENT